MRAAAAAADECRERKLKLNEKKKNKKKMRIACITHWWMETCRVFFFNATVCNVVYCEGFFLFNII